MNLYTYVSNNPLKYIDPTGHWGQPNNDFKGPIVNSDDDQWIMDSALFLINEPWAPMSPGSMRIAGLQTGKKVWSAAKKLWVYIKNSDEVVKDIVTYTFSKPNVRHFASKVTQKSIAKEQNTVIESWVDVTGDINAINAGSVARVGDTFTINGRTYGFHDNAIYPISGAGFHSLDRGAYKALGVYNTFGNTDRATEILDNMKTTKETREAALKVWEVLQK